MTETRSSARRVVVIGTGAVGGAVARRLLAGGREVVVWNRTAGRSAGLVDAGALPAGSVREAVSSGDLILLTLTDYAAVRQCLAELDMDLSGRTIVGMYTGTADEARRAARRAAVLGRPTSMRASRPRPRRSAPVRRSSCTAAPGPHSRNTARRSAC
nr:hypothetical protein GCM10020093_014930 [Planobispora longispora]